MQDNNNNFLFLSNWQLPIYRILWFPHRIYFKLFGGMPRGTKGAGKRQQSAEPSKEPVSLQLMIPWILIQVKYT